MHLRIDNIMPYLFKSICEALIIGHCRNIGHVEKLHRDDSGLFQYAEIAPSATISLLDYVFVVSAGATEEAP